MNKMNLRVKTSYIINLNSVFYFFIYFSNTRDYNL